MRPCLLDTSVVIDLDLVDVVDALPDQVAISAVTLAELAAGPALATDLVERARRQFRLQQVEARFDPIAFDVDAARAFGQLVAMVTATGRSPRSRAVDLMIAATALSSGMDLATRNPDDFLGLDGLLRVVTV
jgi:predicted nucleic acid-binding protein